jgi:hypothetical protein
MDDRAVGRRAAQVVGDDFNEAVDAELLYAGEHDHLEAADAGLVGGGDCGAVMMTSSPSSALSPRAGEHGETDRVIADRHGTDRRARHWVSMPAGRTANGPARRLGRTAR